MAELAASATAAWMMLKINMVIYGFLSWEFISQFPDEIRLIFYPIVRKFVQTGDFDSHTSACCLLLSRLLLIPLLAFKFSLTFVGGSDDDCTNSLQGVTVTIAIGIFNAQMILTLRTLAISNARLRIKFALWTLLIANLTTWAYTAARLKAASITTWYPSFGFICHIVRSDTYAFTTTFVINLLAELIMAYYTIVACIKALSAEFVDADEPMMKRIKTILVNRRSGPDSLTRRVATSALDQSVWLFFLTVLFDIIGAIWVFVFFCTKGELEKGTYLIPFKELIVFAIVPRTIISMKRLTVDSAKDPSVDESQPLSQSLPHPPHLTPLSTARHRHLSCSSLTGSVSSPMIVASTQPGSASSVRKRDQSIKNENLGAFRGYHQGTHNGTRQARLLALSFQLERVAAVNRDYERHHCEATLYASA